MTPLRLVLGSLAVGAVVLLTAAYLSWQIPAMLATGTQR